MDATPTNHVACSYSDGAPVVLAATSEAAIARGMRAIHGLGLRVAGPFALDDACARLALQASASAIWIELDEDGGPAMDGLLEQVSLDVREGRYSAVIATSARLVDPVMSRIDEPAIDVIVEAADAERAAALATAVSLAARPLRLSDVASDQNAARLRQLSEEVSRIATTLARLSSGPQAQIRPVETVQAAELPEISAETVRAVIRARRLRSRYFPEELFADPAWDMLLDLLQAELSHLRVPVSSLCIAAAVPATTALRWLKTLVEERLFARRADPHDGRRVFVELAPDTSLALRRYFAEVGQVGTI
jgi:hypothetical protein